MTAQRQERNGSRAAIEFRPGIAFILLLAVLVLSSAGAQGISGLAAQAATTERVIVSRYSGLAIEGFDPVAYFVDARPVAGLPEFEASEGGAVWRFHNEGNRASFVAHPEIYGPQFGGYDPIDLGRGVTFAGNPRFWLIAGQRLYLFGREENRDTFAADPERFLRAANSRWPQLERNLAQ
jgi:YHS domain-containing protein